MDDDMGMVVFVRAALAHVSHFCCPVQRWHVRGPAGTRQTAALVIFVLAAI
ncbi:hypothetical protein [Streptacidiphilus sp. PAMC 29251]